MIDVDSDDVVCGTPWTDLIEDLASGKMSVLSLFEQIPKDGQYEEFVTFTRAMHILMRDVRIVQRLHAETTAEIRNKTEKFQTSDEFERNVKKKDGSRLFEKLAEVRKDLFENGPRFITGATFDEAIKQYQGLISHVERLWEDSCRLYREKHFPLSTFVSILAIEEVGKLGMLWYDLLAWDRPHTSVQADMGQLGRDHRKKHFMAVMAGAVINSRLDRILGLQRVKRILQDVESGKLEDLRQSCLYINFKGGKVVMPEDLISEADAKFFAILAGELWAENLAHFPWDFHRMIQKVSDFEIELGYEQSQIDGAGHTNGT